ncbi:MAG: MoaD/ThiS family protein [Anaerolineae bacterium]
MKEVELRYVAHITDITGVPKERYRTGAATLRDLVEELEARYGGFREAFVDPATGRLRWNAMIYYRSPGEVPVAVVDLDQPLGDGAAVTFW